mgnify:CR=1 FL=1
MTIGDWTIDDAGMIKHLKYKESAGSWLHHHRCWISAGYISTTGHEAGAYKDMMAPEFV